MSAKNWPDHVGINAEESKKRILAENPHLRIDILPENSITTRDYRVDRVRIFVKEDNTVASVPKIG